MDGIIRQNHPRILLPELAGWNGQEMPAFIAARLENYRNAGIAFLSNCSSNSLLTKVSCGLSGRGQFSVGELRNALTEFKPTELQNSEKVSNVWELALAYDLFYSALSVQDRVIIENKIKNGLEHTLIVLDDDVVSMWHSRSTHAAIAWLCAVVLSDGSNSDVAELRRRAQGHFVAAMDALAFTEVWPSGYNYWINDRGLLFALAASAYVNGLEGAENSQKIKQIISRVGYWHLYATRPDNRIEGFGDEGPRIDLKDETRRVIDLIAQVTRDSVLAGYSHYLYKLHGVESYYRGHRWGFLFFNDPTIDIAGDGTLTSLGRLIDDAALFGTNSMNYLYVHNGWNLDDTFITYKAGHNFSHHGHYDAGHFTLFKGAPLIVNSSQYEEQGFFAPNRLNYAIRTIAKNSLIVQKPGEEVRPNRFFKENVSDGGQRLTMPTGSAITGVEDWYTNYLANKHYEAAELAAYENNSDFVYIASDITHAYNNRDYDQNGAGGKVANVTRKLFYVKDADLLVVRDSLMPVQSSYATKMLLHTIDKPLVNNERILKGATENGILETTDKAIHVANGVGRLVIHIVEPDASYTHLVGGDDFRNYVETDGDDTVLDGVNYPLSKKKMAWFDDAKWRIEIQSKGAEATVYFLTAFLPSTQNFRDESVRRLVFTQQGLHGLEVGDNVVIFADKANDKIEFSVVGEIKSIYLLGLENSRQMEVYQQDIPLAQRYNKLPFVHKMRLSEPVRGQVAIKVD